MCHKFLDHEPGFIVSAHLVNALLFRVLVHLTSTIFAARLRRCRGIIVGMEGFMCSVR